MRCGGVKQATRANGSVRQSGDVGLVVVRERRGLSGFDLLRLRSLVQERSSCPCR
jgi:hypothetical protein